MNVKFQVMTPLCLIIFSLLIVTQQIRSLLVPMFEGKKKLCLLVTNSLRELWFALPGVHAFTVREKEEKPLNCNVMCNVIFLFNFLGRMRKEKTISFNLINCL